MPKRSIPGQFGLVLLLLIKLFPAKGQDSTLRYSASMVIFGSTRATPFWQHANQLGTVPLNGRFAMGRWAMAKSYTPGTVKLLQWQAGAELITSYGSKQNIFFTDLFAAIKLGPLELLAGQKNNRTGLADSNVSTGSLAVSENARPFPRIQLAIPEFYPLWFTAGFVSLKASYSDGVLTDSPLLYGDTKYRPVTFFHQKTLYLRLGMPDQRLAFYTGFNHQVIWGGENRIWPADSINRTRAYFHAITGKALGYKKTGLHFGTIDVAAEWTGLNWTYLLYRQNIFETGSLYRIINFEDGLNGLRIKRTNPLPENTRFFALQTLVLEFISTKSQLNRHTPFGLSIYEQANYFNSFLYQTGWSYRGSGIGTPLASAQSTTDNKLPSNPTLYTNNNRFLALHTGVAATWLGTALVFKGTYSLNYGSYLTPFDAGKQQISLFLSAERKISFWKGLHVIGSISSDYGKLYPNSTGGCIGLLKKGIIR